MFEKDDKNLAYIYADKNIRSEIEEEQKILTNDDDDGICIKLLKDWKLEKYIEILIDENGYDDVEGWPELGFEELKRYGFKDGHARTFVRKTKAYLDK